MLNLLHCQVKFFIGICFFSWGKLLSLLLSVRIINSPAAIAPPKAPMRKTFMAIAHSGFVAHILVMYFLKIKK